jgi:hypothetical protein
MMKFHQNPFWAHFRADHVIQYIVFKAFNVHFQDVYVVVLKPLHKGSEPHDATFDRSLLLCIWFR